MGIDRTTGSALGKYMTLSVLLPAGTCVGYAMGYGVDSLFGTGWIRFLGLAMGAAGGFISLVRELDPPKKKAGPPQE